MSSCVNLLTSLLDTASRLHQAGRHNDAFAYLCKLTRLRDLPAEVAVEAHFRMAEILLKRGQPSRARKHLKTVLKFAPEHAEAHRLMGEAQESGRLSDPYAALEHYRRAVQLRPDQAEWLCAAGRLALRQGLGEEGLGYLRQAAEAADDEPDLLRQVVDGLLLANRADEARSLLRAALFRHSGDRRYRAVWEHLQFQQLRQQQSAALAKRQMVADDEPVLLPFVPAAPPARRARIKVVRHDTPGVLAGPHPVVIARPTFAR